MYWEKLKNVYRSTARSFNDLTARVSGTMDFNSNKKCVKSSGLFDAKWYLTKYPDIAKSKVDPLEHYLKLGGFEGRCPSPNFDSAWYLKEYSDVLQGGMSPLLHYIRHGKKEGRKPLPSSQNEKNLILPKSQFKIPLVLKGNLENIVFNSGILKVNGWVLLGEKIKKIEVYFNDVLLDPAQGAVCYGKAREDIKNANPLVEGSLYSGFEAIYHLDPLIVPKDVSFTIKVRATDDKGRSGELTKNVRGASSGGSEATVLGNGILMDINSILYSQSGTMLIIGWIDDRKSPLSNVIVFAGHNRVWETTAFGRLKRPDVESALKSKSCNLFGFWSVLTFDRDFPIGSSCVVCGQLADGRYGQLEKTPQMLNDTELRSTILAHFSTIESYYGNRDMEKFLSLDTGIGTGLIDLNRRIIKTIVAEPWVSYYGPTRESYAGSIIVCLFGKPEFLFLQSALFSLAAEAGDYEFIFVSNSPELSQILEKEAQICARIYGISIVLVCLPNNAGFGPANNIAFRFARSKRLLFTNPDVFPRDNDWARRHTDIIKTAPKDQTLIFGAPLYYDDGSLMHQGIYFRTEPGVLVSPEKVSSFPLIFTEHYGKGAPAWSKQFDCPRPVPAVTGAFMSIDRDWFETLGGFNEDYLFGHYEDVDLCLKSLVRGKPVWIHDFPMWHMESKGSTKQTSRESSSILFNQWLFTRQWGDLITRELLGPEPSCRALHESLASNFDREENKVRGAA